MSSSSPLKAKQFFPELEGVRGIAILMVFLFHFMPNICPHGYLGVDVFLVISGYFLCKGALTEEAAPFEWRSFLLKKVLRLMPPLIVMVLCITCVSVCLIPSSTLLTSFKTAWAALSGYSNIYLDSTNNAYFGAGTKTNLFTHTWYLSSLIHAYLIFAVVFLIGRMGGKKTAWVVLISLGILSALYANSRFLYRILYPAEALSSLYYSTPARLCELVIGGLIVLAKPMQQRYPLHALIYPLIALIFSAAFLPFSLQPVVILCSAMVIYCATGNGGTSLLAHQVFCLPGRYSYSIYLWHWPVFVLANYYFEDQGILGMLPFMVVAVILGAVGYRFAEKPKWHLAAIIGTWLLAAGAVQAFIQFPELHQFMRQTPYTSGKESAPAARMVYSQDFPADVLGIWEEGQQDERGEKGNLRLLGNESATPSFVMMGDSHAGALAPGLDAMLREEHLSGYYITSYITPFDNRMAARANFRFDKAEADACRTWLAAHPEITHVVLIQRWSIRMKDVLNDESLPLHYDGSPVTTENLYNKTVVALKDFCLSLRRIGKQVVVMTEVPPIAEDTPLEYLTKAYTTGHAVDQSRLVCTPERYEAVCGRQRDTLRHLERMGLFRLISIESAAFADGAWNALHNNMVLMKDDDHVSAGGAMWLTTKTKEAWLKALAPTDHE